MANTTNLVAATNKTATTLTTTTVPITTTAENTASTRTESTTEAENTIVTSTTTVAIKETTTLPLSQSLNLLSDPVVTTSFIDSTEGVIVAIEDLGSTPNVVGSMGNDVIIGDARSNTIESGGGDDEVSGGPGNDTFVISHNPGRLTINDFDVRSEKIDFSYFPTLTYGDLTIVRFDEVSSLGLRRLTDNIKTTVIVDKNHSIILNNVTANQLQEENFYFSSVIISNFVNELENQEKEGKCKWFDSQWCLKNAVSYAVTGTVCLGILVLVGRAVYKKVNKVDNDVSIISSNNVQSGLSVAKGAFDSPPTPEVSLDVEDFDPPPELLPDVPPTSSAIVLLE